MKYIIEAVHRLLDRLIDRLFGGYKGEDWEQ